MFLENSGCLLLLVFFLIFAFPKLFMILITFPFLVFIIIFLFIAFGGNVFFQHLNLNNYVNNQTTAHNLFGQYLIKFMMYIAKADGVVDSVEIRLIKTFFQNQMRYSGTQMLWVKQLIKEALYSDESIEQISHEFNIQFGINEKRILIVLLYQIAQVDAHIKETEQKQIDKIVMLLEFPAHEHQSIKDMIFQQSSKAPNPLKTLGLNDEASPEEIKKKYRELCKEYHPDKVTHLGDDFKSVAQKKMVEINNAYEALKKMNKV
ncbi:MAG: Heat shock protein DnaJ-like protein [uncultured bacterium]|nr:MAG: Heat shock protein DnaJ-like protein [uncultured bacterium]